MTRSKRGELILVLGALVAFFGTVMGQPNWPFSGYLGDGGVMAQGEGLIYLSIGGDIWMTASDGRMPINLTNTSSSWEEGPCVSVGRRTGELVVFVSDRGRASWDCALWLMNPDGTSARQLTFPPAGTGHYLPCWSPRCRDIVFTELDASGTSILRIVDVETGNVRGIPSTNLAGGSISSFGAGTTAYVRAIAADWVRTAIRIGQDHHAWLYLLDHSQDGPPCYASGRTPDVCGLDDIELAVRLSSNPNCHIHINAYNPVCIDPAFFNQNGCWSGQAGWLELQLADTWRDDNSGGVVAILIPALSGAP